MYPHRVALVCLLLVVSSCWITGAVHSGDGVGGGGGGDDPAMSLFNFTVPTFCNPNNTLPALTWCRYNNPYILSDFLSRNSTDLTANAAANSPFDDKKPFKLSVKCRDDPGSDQGGARSCSAISQIRTAAYGIVNQPNLTTRLVVFTDTDGQLLFVNFNTNRMMTQLKVNVTSVKFFDSGEYARSTSSQQVTDLVLLVANNSQLTLGVIPGDSGNISTCTIFTNVTHTNGRGNELELAEFYPKKPNATTVPVNMLWIWSRNYTRSRIVEGKSVEPWMKGLIVYDLSTVPVLQNDIAGFIDRCPKSTPMGIEMQTQFFSPLRVKFTLYHNTVSNMTFIAAYSNRSVSLYRVEYNGTKVVGNGFTDYLNSRVLISPWCEPHEMWNHTANKYQRRKRLRSTVFCVPEDGTSISTVRLLSVDHFTHIGDNTKALWLIIALKNKTHTYMHVVALQELMVIPNDNSTLTNPLGLPDTFGTPQFPCNFATHVFVQLTGLCEPRFVVNMPFEGSEPISSIKLVPIQVPSNAANSTNSSDSNTTSNTNATLPPGEYTPDVPIPIVSMEHVSIFVSRRRMVEIFSLHQAGPAVGDKAPPLVIEKLNTVRFMGNVEYLHVSDNAQHLFAAVSRREWELESQTRYLDICTQLDRNPTDPFLAPYHSKCRSLPPQPVNLNSFTQYASYCSTMVYCPSLNEVMAELPPTGYYAERPAVQKPCPKGHFCTLGQKQLCPPGFYCGEEGMSAPTKCNESLTFDTTCANYGQHRPEPCPQGEVCFVNHIPGLPAPPGWMIPKPSAARLRTDFTECPEGWWCNIGVQQPYNGSGIPADQWVCPENTFCSNSSVEQPTVCRCDDPSKGRIINGSGATIDCHDRTMYCPSGTSRVQWCPAGSYCTYPNVSKECLPTQYCPNGTFAPQLCPAGYYCPNPSEKLICPAHHFCRRGTVQPTVCNYLTVCPAGSQSESRSFLAPVALVGVVIGVILGFALFSRYKAKQDLKVKAIRPLSALARQYLLTGGEDPSSHVAFHETSMPISRFQTPHITFDKMGLTLAVGEAKGKKVLDNVTGEIPPGSFVAVMGPSGSGKSTFMHTLAGKAFYGDRSGRVLVNGDEVNLNKFSKVMGFVKQDDIMLREMTVNETLLFNAKMRYDSKGMESPEEISNAMLRVLDLNHVRDINIGDEKKRGISGGQRKRVNIGMEMCALPCILFLDEPTSGLDSSSSMTVCSALREMADSGITVIAVIHQPRYEIFQMFHKVLLLAKGGKLVYYGEPDKALPYFEEELMLKCPQHVNPPDFFMDSISGENDRNLTVDEMQTKWETHFARLGTSKTTPKENTKRSIATDSEVPVTELSALNASRRGGEGAGRQSGHQLAKDAASKTVPGFFAQLTYFTARSMVQLSRDLVWFFTDLVLVLVAGFFLGLVFSNSEYLPPLPKQLVNKSLEGFHGSAPPNLVNFFNRPIDDPIISEASLTCMALGMTGVTAALRVFGNEQIVYWREASAGMSTTAYFLAKNITHLFFIILSPLLYLTPFLTFVSARAPLQDYYWICVLIQFTTTGLGYLVSIVAPPGLAQLAGVVTVLVFSMFGGARPTLPEIQKMFSLLHAMPYVSYIRWGQEALYLTEIKQWADVVDINPSMELFGYHLSDFTFCVWATVAFGFLFRVLALVAMMSLNRHQKH